MKAVVYEKYGSPDVLEQREIEESATVPIGGLTALRCRKQVVSKMEITFGVWRIGKCGHVCSSDCKIIWS